MSLLIKNAKCYIDGKLLDKNILCVDGKISKITSLEPKADEVLNTKGKVALPGFIDPHVHFREPGLTHKEDFLSGSRAAAKGGITTIQDMPNTIPPTFTVDALVEKRKLAAKSVVNWGLHFGAAQNNINEIKKAKNIPSVKVYMDHTTGNLKIDDYSILKDIFDAMPITCLHAENENITKALSYLKSAKGSAYICHTSSEAELKLARMDKALNTRVFVEVSPQHLFMSVDDVKKIGHFAEMKPRLKTMQDQKALWAGIKEGTVNTIGTDHAPHLPSEKKKDDFPFGIPGVETMVPLLLDAYHNKRIELQKIVQLCSENTSRIFRMKTKGAIKAGFDADITLVDLEMKKKVSNDELLSKCGWSPFDGKLLKGWPVATIVNGNIVYDGETVHDIKAREVVYG
jgi:dihydroorotase